MISFIPETIEILLWSVYLQCFTYHHHPRLSITMEALFDDDTTFTWLLIFLELGILYWVPAEIGCPKKGECCRWRASYSGPSDVQAAVSDRLQQLSKGSADSISQLIKGGKGRLITPCQIGTGDLPALCPRWMGQMGRGSPTSCIHALHVGRSSSGIHLNEISSSSQPLGSN